jgi:hypothetical protein
MLQCAVIRRAAGLAQNQRNTCAGSLVESARFPEIAPIFPSSRKVFGKIRENGNFGKISRKLRISAKLEFSPDF